MRIAKHFSLQLVGGVALIAAAAPGFAQGTARARAAGGDRIVVQVVAATADKRATNLRRAPIAIDIPGIAALNDPTQSGQASLAPSGLDRSGRN